MFKLEVSSSIDDEHFIYFYTILTYTHTHVWYKVYCFICVIWMSVEDIFWYLTNQRTVMCEKMSIFGFRNMFFYLLQADKLSLCTLVYDQFLKSSYKHIFHFFLHSKFLFPPLFRTVTSVFVIFIHDEVCCENNLSFIYFLLIKYNDLSVIK